MIGAKPEYKVPSMADIQAVPWNGLNVVSTFSGCGGTCLGYEMAGYRILWANEFVPAAREGSALNHPGTLLDGQDIRQVTPEAVLEATGMAVGAVDVLEGSPPCAAFSSGGDLEEGWGKVREYSDTHQRTDDLFWEFARLVRGIQPKVVIAENVAGIMRGAARGYFKQVYQMLCDCGYKVEARLLDAAWLGVPQSRRRVFIQGVREDLALEPTFPAPWPYTYTVAEVLPHIQSVELANGGPRQGHAYRPTNRPALTVQQGRPVGVHLVGNPEMHRRMTIAELKPLCGFPDDFQVTGTYNRQWERLGRAVPPLMARAVAESIQQNLTTAEPVKRRRRTRGKGRVIKERHD